MYYKSGVFDVEHPIDRWHDEDFVWYSKHLNGWCRTAPCGHYTQLIAARTKYLGCGKAFCDAPYDPDTGMLNE